MLAESACHAARGGWNRASFTLTQPMMLLLFTWIRRIFASKRWCTAFGLVASFLLHSLVGAAQPAAAHLVPTQRLDSLLTTLAAHDKLMGSVTLSHAGQVVYQRAFGFQQLAPAIPATPTTHYLIGSATKMFTAVLIFQLVEEKKLTLATPLATFFPQLPHARRITIDHLLHHRSGLYNFTTDSAWVSGRLRIQQPAQLLRLIGQGPPAFAPGTQAAYNNSGYVLLGYIIERITKHSYAQAVHERIGRKVGLRDTYGGSVLTPARQEAYAYQISPTGWRHVPSEAMGYVGGAGVLESTPTDLTRFLEALFRGRLVSAASLRRMQTIREGYGRGLFARPFADHAGYGHTGGINGFVTLATYFPAEQLAVALCSNAQNYSPQETLAGILSLYFQQPYHLPTFAPSSFIPAAADLVRYAGTYVSTQLPGLKITMSVSGQTLQTQATNQPPATLDCQGPGLFTFAQGRNSLRVEFAPDQPSFVLTQGGSRYTFLKE